MPGYRQALEWQAHGPGEGSDVEHDMPAVVQELLLLWSLGEMSAAAVQRLAHSLVLDGLRHEKIVELAALGAFGQQPGNVSRDLLTRYAGDIKVCNSTKLQVPCLDPKSNPKLSREETSMLLPHDLFVSLATEYNDTFSAIMGLDKIPDFWKQIRRDDWHWTSEYRQADFSNPYCIPLWLHGDAVEYADKRSAMVLSWGSLTCLGFAPTVSALFACCFAKQAINKDEDPDGVEDTFLPLWQQLKWSFEALLQGDHPSRDHNGDRFPPGSYRARMAGKPLFQPVPHGPKYRACLWSIVGDYEWFSLDLNLPHWMSKQMCGWCNARRDDDAKLWSCFKHKGWKSKSINDYEANPVFTQPHILYTFPFVQSLSVCIDVLHCVDLGVLLRYEGSVLKHLIYHELPSDARTNLDRVWEAIQHRYEPNCKSRLTTLTLAMIVPKPKSPHASHPVLKLKAAEARHFLPPLTSCCEALRPKTKVQKLRLLGLKQLCSWYEILDEIEFVPNDAQAEKLKSLLHGFLLVNEELCEWARKQGFNIYEPVPKNHYSYHLAELAKYISPKRVWSYKQESFMGVIAGVANSCSFGTKLPRIGFKITEKMRYLMHFHWQFGRVQDNED